MGNKKRFEKDLRDYLTDASDYDISRIVAIFDKYDSEPIIQKEKVYVTKIERVFIKNTISHNDAVAFRKGKTPYPQISADDIVDICANVFSVNRNKIFEKRRFKQVAVCRQCAYYMLYKYTLMTAVSIGKYLGGKDHTTVLYGITLITNVIENEQSYAYEAVMQIQENIYKLIQQRKNATSNIERISEGNTSNIKTEGILRRAI